MNFYEFESYFDFYNFPRGYFTKTCAQPRNVWILENLDNSLD